MKSAMKSAAARFASLFALSMATACIARAANADAPLLHPLFQDHAVLQRDAPIRIFGHTRPGDDLRIAFAGKDARAHADADGRWEVLLPTFHAGGPYALTVSTARGATQTIDDVLIGDVWLCSGQSNMEIQMHRALDSRSEIAGASNQTIRLLTIAESGSVVPMENFSAPVQWQVTTPATVRDFSATCFYFARELQKKVAVPMGLIEAASGGSRIQAWISAEGLRTIGPYNDELDVLAQYAKNPLAATARWGEIWAAWWRARPGLAKDDAPWDPARPAGSGWRAAPRALIGYQQWGVPDLTDFNGMLWYRTTIKLTAQQAAQDSVLALGSADEMDQTWVNGRSVGSSYGGNERSYPLPPHLLHAGENLIAVNVHNTYKDGGLVGPSSTRALRFADGSSVPLDGAWQYRKVPTSYGSPPRAPWQAAAGICTLYNGMIMPMGHFGIRGMLWYQGESNTFEAERYRDLLRVLRSDWRARFGRDLPLLIVQLAAYGAAPTKPDESDWAQLREVQRAVAAEDAHSGLAVTIDIGDRYDVHPSNKQELGRRLARAARHFIYAEPLPPSGPVPLSTKRDGDAVVVAFGDVSNGLVAYGADGPIGFALCGAQPGSCRYASAEIHSSNVILHAANAATSTRVRYGWADSPVVTLFDGAGLPAGPFELPISSPSAEKR
jgi:sialate O-acetylesterase